MKIFTKIIKIVGIVLGAVIVLIAVVFGYLTITEYNPEDVETVEVSKGTESISTGDDLTVVTFNIGYGGYDRDEDFFMDGGTNVRQKSADAIEANLAGIASILEEQDADVYFLQEVDRDSYRSFNINEENYLKKYLGMGSAFATNFQVAFIPYPIPPIGKVYSGLTTLTNLNVTSAERYELPCPFKWPVRIANLKRCVLTERIPVEGTDKELVIMNLHLEAYDNGEGKIAQTNMLKELIAAEYAEGNYVIAGGDFNQAFDVVEQPEIKYPGDWMPGTINMADLPEGFSFAVADNAYTCRSLGREYIDEDHSQTYIIDGFIVSDNLEVTEVEVVDADFTYSDHNPVRLEVRLK